MVTVRTYWSPAQAALAKSLLDNYEIPCALLDENSSVYSRGGQFAIPIRLAVDESEVDRAISILNGEFHKADEIELRDDASSSAGAPEMPERANRNPWELLVVAFYLLVPAICLIATKFPTNVAGRYGRYYVARATIAHFLSWLAAVGAVFLVGLYFVVRRSANNQTLSDEELGSEKLVG